MILLILCDFFGSILLCEFKKLESGFHIPFFGGSPIRFRSVSFLDVIQPGALMDFLSALIMRFFVSKLFVSTWGSVVKIFGIVSSLDST